MQHCSGMVYEGLWINGRPANFAHKLSIKAISSPLDVIQGQPFTIDIEVQNEEGEIVTGDFDRHK